MLSASAARMGCVKTTLREIGKTRCFSVAVGRRESGLLPVGKRNSQFRVVLASNMCRWKSTMAAYTDLDAQERAWDKSHGHAEALKVRSTFAKEAWMINLGRGDNNRWLLGPRDPDEWFTGLKPSSCPGKFANCKLKNSFGLRIDSAYLKSATFL